MSAQICTALIRIESKIKSNFYWKKVDTHAILCCLVKSLNCVVYEHILIKRVIEEVKRMLTAVNVSRVFTQSLTLILSCFIEAARTSLLNTFT